jgi:hypothetical protein
MMDIFNPRFKEYKDLIAFSCFGTDLTFGELDTHSNSMASYL